MRPTMSTNYSSISPNGLRKAFPNFSPDQVKPQTYSVTVSFRGSGLDVDVVPILYDGDPQWYGSLVSQDDGSFLKTSIPLHFDFTRKRKDLQEPNFAQVVRLVKFWAGNIKREREDFRFKSFMIEMILSHLCDQGLDFADYPESLQHFFSYVARSNMREKIIFTDYYAAATVGSFPEPVQIIDPVNAENNVSRLYTAVQADAIVDAALDAGDAIDAALAAPTKQENDLLLAKGLRPFVSGVRGPMSYSYTSAETSTFTRTHAKHMAAKVATDLKRMQRFYGRPNDSRIVDYETEVIEFLKEGYLGTVIYGFRRNGNWIEPTLNYTARDLAGASANDHDPGRIRPGADISGASFYSYLTYSLAWNNATEVEKEAFRGRLPFPAKRGTGTRYRRLSERRPDLFVGRSRTRPGDRKELVVTMRPAIDDLFERRIVYPDFEPQERLAALVGLDNHKTRLAKILGLLINPAGLDAWAKKFHPGANGLLKFGAYEATSRRSGR